jgi:HSP20 family protein
MAQERHSTLVPERWQPLRDVEQVNERMRRLLEDTFGGMPAGLAELAWTPPVDIEETDDAYVVEAELPGVRREDVSIELAGNELSITGEIKEKERTGIVRRRTRRVGRYELRVVLPDNIDGDKVDAKLKDGVLRVSVPKSERAERRRIEVNS